MKKFFKIVGAIAAIGAGVAGGLCLYSKLKHKNDVIDDIDDYDDDFLMKKMKKLKKLRRKLRLKPQLLLFSILFKYAKSVYYFLLQSFEYPIIIPGSLLFIPPI